MTCCWHFFLLSSTHKLEGPLTDYYQTFQPISRWVSFEILGQNVRAYSPRIPKTKNNDQWRIQCSLARIMDGRIMHCGIISSCQSAAASEIVKCFWSWVWLV